MIESWSQNPEEMGPIYPFLGFEFPLFAICLGIWILFTIWQLNHECAHYSSEEKKLKLKDTLE